MARSPLMQVMTQAVLKAARSLRRDFGEIEHLQVANKGPGDFVTAADLRTEKILREELGKARPDYGFLMEEAGEIEGKDKDHRWIVDPLDGTTNFMHALPHFSISVAAEHRGQLVAGVIYNPIRDEMFTAEKGGGAYLNERQRLRVAQRRSLEEALVVCGLPHRGRGNHQQFTQEMTRVMSKAIGLRRTGSAALDLAYIAAGRFDAYWERGLSPWDTAAGLVIVREAGGTVLNADGGTDVLGTGSVVAGNQMLTDELIKTLRG